MKKSWRAIAALGLVLALIGVASVAVKGAYGAFAHTYPVKGIFIRAGQGLIPSSEVEYRGVKVGEVSSIGLIDSEAMVKLAIHDNFSVPVNALATVRPKSLFGEEFVDLTFPTGQSGPYIPSGGLLRHTFVAGQIGNLIDHATPLFQQINPTDLQTLITNLDAGVSGQGQAIAASIDDGTKLAALLSDTITAQTQALDSFSRFQAVLANTGPLFNAIAANSNQALPVLNAAEASFQHLLETLQPLADNVAALLANYRPDINTILVAGDNVTRVLVANQQNISDLIHGLYRYLYKIGTGASSETLANGSKFAYFKAFILFDDVKNLICGLLSPTQPGLGATLAPLVSALNSANSPLDCSVRSTPAPTGPSPGPPTPPAVAKTASPSALTQALANQANTMLGTPQVPILGSVGSMINALLGRP
ncbi:MAG: MCE family protein [Acidimicrobiales bacterium]